MNDPLSESRWTALPDGMALNRSKMGALGKRGIVGARGAGPYDPSIEGRFNTAQDHSNKRKSEERGGRLLRTPRSGEWRSFALEDPLMM
jgi:hypothetical protein